MMFDDISIDKETKRITEKTYVCEDCLEFLTLRGALKNTFIIRIDSKNPILCEICNHNPAKFLVKPYEKGLWICDDCLEDRGHKHVWQTYKVVEESKAAVCEICFEKGAKHIVPLKRKAQPLFLIDSTEEE